MPGVYTSGIPAKVIQDQTFPDRPDVLLVNESVGHNVTALIPLHAVSEPPLPEKPFPASGLFVDPIELRLPAIMTKDILERLAPDPSEACTALRGEIRLLTAPAKAVSFFQSPDPGIFPSLTAPFSSTFFAVKTSATVVCLSLIPFRIPRMVPKKSSDPESPGNFSAM